MIYLHEIAKIDSLPHLDDGIHYAAREIRDPEQVLTDIRRMLMSALVVGYMPTRITQGALAGEYSDHELSALYSHGINPLPVNADDSCPMSTNFFVWRGAIECFRAPGTSISRAFKSYVMHELWQSKNGPDRVFGGFIAIPSQMPAESDSGLLRAFTTRRQQIGLYTPF